MPYVAEVREVHSAVPMRGYRLDQQRRGVATEIPVEFYSDINMAEMVLWTEQADRLRVKLGAGAYVAVGADRSTAVSLGAFTAGEIKSGTIEVKIPTGTDTRREDLILNLGSGT